MERVWGQVNKYNPGVSIHLLDLFGVMERCVVHDQHGMGLWPSTTMCKKLFDEVLEDITVGSTLKYTREKNTILGGRR